MNKFMYFEGDEMTIDPNVEPLIGEVCHKYDLKVLNQISIRRQWGGNYFTLDQSQSQNSDRKDMFYGYILTKNGFPNVICWYADGSYHISADCSLKERGDSKYLHAKKLSDLLRKFDKRLNYRPEYNPLKDVHWVDTRRANKLQEQVTKTSEKKKSYDGVMLSGSSLHLLLEGFINNADMSTSNRKEYEDKLSILNSHYKSVQQSLDTIRQKLEKPFYVIGKSNMSCSDDTCIVFKAKVEDGKFKYVTEPKAYKKFEDSPYHDKLRPILSMYAIAEEDKAKGNHQWLLDKIIPDRGFYMDNSYYDEDTQVGSIDEYNTHTEYKMVYTYILDVD